MDTPVCRKTSASIEFYRWTTRESYYFLGNDHLSWLISSATPPPVPLPEIGSSGNVLGWFGSNILCHWNGLPAVGPAKEGTNQIIVRELRGAEFVQRAAIALDSGMRPAGFTFNATRQLLAWTEGTSSAPVYLASLAAPGR